jgi:hypothetical protein
VNFIEIENGITNLNFHFFIYNNVTLLVSVIGINWFQMVSFINRKRFLVIFTNYLSLFKMGWIRSFPLSNLMNLYYSYLGF